jgi:uncharacterized protein (TIGR02118 family)
MIKQISLIKAKAGMSPEAFRSHYENIHAPLARSLFPMVQEYRRSYLDRNGAPLSGQEMPDFDVVTELWFKDAAAFAAFRERYAEPEIKRQLRDDEMNFLRVGEITSFVVEEFIS